MARALAAAGATVMIADVQDDARRQVAEGARATGHGFVHLDVTDDAELGGGRRRGRSSTLGGLDILVNNAGIEITSLITEVDADDVRKMLEVNMLGTALGLKHGLRAMRPGGAGRQGRRDHQHLLGRRDHRLPRHRGLLRRPSRRSTG